MKIVPKYGYCSSCRELFKWDNIGFYCPNEYHEAEMTIKLYPCWEIWVVKDWVKPPPKKLLVHRCKTCVNRFVCLTNGLVDVQ